MITRVLLSFFLISSLLSCKKDDKTPYEQLPAATQEGKSTFGCLINGEVFTPKSNSIKASLTATYYKGGIILIKAYRSEDEKNIKKYLYLSSKDTSILKTGSYPLGIEQSKSFTGFYIDLINNCEMQTDSINTGMLTITRYTPPPGGSSRQGIISGTFYFTVKKVGCPDVHITDGRFDIAF